MKLFELLSRLTEDDVDHVAKSNLDANKTNDKAGFIPYYFDEDGTPHMAFIISSNPQYGGADPQVAKGGVDAGEDVKAAGFREGAEELGLRKSNVKHIDLAWSGTIQGLKRSYKMFIYMGEVKNKDDFDTPDHETGKVVWLTFDEFKSKGRKSQLEIVKSLIDKLG